jgi:hypothetical protein
MKVGQATVVTVAAESESHYSGHFVYLGGALIGFRPYSGSNNEEVVAEVTESLALLLRERLDWKTSP